MTREFSKSDACQNFQDGVQRFLDGTVPAFPADLQAHATTCGDCRSSYQTVQALQNGLKRFAKVTPSANWTDRTVAAVLSQGLSENSTRLLIRRIVPWLAVAAALLLAVMLWRPWSPRQSAPVANAPGSPAPILVDKSLDEARSAVVGLTRRAADETVKPPLKLLPAELPSPALAARDPLPGAIDPAAQSLEEIRQGAASGLEPMRNSAMRAFAIFTPHVPANKKHDP
jgi:hypothetical protein